MIEQIYREPDIFRIFVPLPDNPLKNLNCYIIQSMDETLILDTGFNRPECREALASGLQELDIDLTKARLFLTHLHGDHSGLVGYFTKRNVPVYMNTIDYAYLNSTLTDNLWGKMEDTFHAEGFPAEEIKKQAISNQARLYSPKEIFPAITIQDGDHLTVGALDFKCIHTPGHTPGHTCLYMENEKIFFSGDHVLFDITPNISIWHDIPSSLEDYMNSLQKIKALDIRHTFPAHREFTGEIHERIDTLINHHMDRLQEILSAVASYPNCSAYETAGRISWSARGRAWTDFSPNQKWFAMGETLAHLKWLQDRQYVIRTSDNGYLALCQTL